MGGACTTREKALNSSPSSKERDGTLQSENSKDSIADGNLIFRNAAKNDAVDIFKWRNHPDIRKNSFNTDTLLWNEHERWFKEKSKDPNSKIYVACYEDEKIGMVRFDEKDDVIKVSVMLNPDFLGKGIGSEVIRLGKDRFINEKKPCKPIIAEIKTGNIASIKAFQKAGYEESCVVYIWKEEKNGN